MHWRSFGPTNVAVQRVSAPAEPNEYGEAAQIGRSVAMPQLVGYHQTVRETHSGPEAAKRQLPDGFLSYAS
ncbi:hypothetical protein PUR28_39665 [Streptomyces sp. BE308]|uniref:hypothetical protein n=1 Tax=Streptomyces sp. BE308 TaxID=3002529 RepID=UPI002E78CD6A|nr:hypothetical protein [Streptomyces sp. BE308]MEE1796836.1 hypothetical protein [Streptomyces sp. BE308]